MLVWILEIFGISYITQCQLIACELRQYLADLWSRPFFPLDRCGIYGSYLSLVLYFCQLLNISPSPFDYEI